MTWECTPRRGIVEARAAKGGAVEVPGAAVPPTRAALGHARLATPRSARETVGGSRGLTAGRTGALDILWASTGCMRD